MLLARIKQTNNYTFKSYINTIYKRLLIIGRLFIGPIYGGYIYDVIGFSWGASTIGIYGICLVSNLQDTT